MATLATARDVLDRAGLHASSYAYSSEAFVDRFIDAAEQTIVAETRRDWVNSYASVPDSVKETLRSCTASHAAKGVINFNMKGFTSRAEAITMINVNLDEFDRTLKALKDIDITDIRPV